MSTVQCTEPRVYCTVPCVLYWTGHRVQCVLYIHGVCTVLNPECTGGAPREAQGHLFHDHVSGCVASVVSTNVQVAIADRVSIIRLRPGVASEWHSQLPVLVRNKAAGVVQRLPGTPAAPQPSWGSEAGIWQPSTLSSVGNVCAPNDRAQRYARWPEGRW